MIGDPESSLEFDDGYAVLRVIGNGNITEGYCFTGRTFACSKYEKMKANSGDCVALIQMKMIVRKRVE